MRLSVSRHDSPASTRMLAVELERTVQFPRLPLAKTVILTGTKGRITNRQGVLPEKTGEPYR
jgi:hypothetical protein